MVRSTTSWGWVNGVAAPPFSILMPFSITRAQIGAAPLMPVVLTIGE